MKSICILLTDGNSINDQIIKKSFRKLKNSKIKKIYFIGDRDIFHHTFLVSKKLKKIEFHNIKNQNNYSYLKKITENAINLHKKKKIDFLINMPLKKKLFLKGKFIG